MPFRDERVIELPAIGAQATDRAVRRKLRREYADTHWLRPPSGRSAPDAGEKGRAAGAEPAAPALEPNRLTSVGRELELVRFRPAQKIVFGKAACKPIIDRHGHQHRTERELGHVAGVGLRI